MALASFLIGGNDTDPNSSWTINTTDPSWKAVLSDSTLGIRASTPTGTDLVVDLTSPTFWELKFSNSFNAATFGSKSPVVADRSDPRIRGAVFRLLPPTSVPLNGPITFAAARSRFGVTQSSSPAVLNSFLDTLDSSGTFGVKLNLEDSTRNAIWFIPGKAHRVVVSLTFDFQEVGIVELLQTYLNKLLGLNLTIAALGFVPKLIMTKITTYTPSTTNPGVLSVTSTFMMIIQFRVAMFEASAIFTPTSMQLVLSDIAGQGVPATSPYDRITSNVANPTNSKISPKSLPDKSKSTAFDKALSSYILWNLTIGLEDAAAQDPNTSVQPDSSKVFWKVALLANFEFSSGTQNLPLAVMLDTRTWSFAGRILFLRDVPTMNTRRQYDYQKWNDITAAIDASQIKSSYDLAAIFGSAKPPKGLPTTIDTGSIVYQRDATSDDYTFALMADLRSAGNQVPDGPTAPNKTPAPSGFQWTSLTLNLLKQSSGLSSATLIASVISNFQLAPSPADPPSDPIAYVHVDLEYVSGSFWYLSANATNIKLAQLGSFFDPSAKDQVVKSLGKLMLKDLNFLYTYTNDSNNVGAASSFLITAVITFGDLELDLYYQYCSPLLQGDSAAALAWSDHNTPDQVQILRKDPTKPTWQFEAFLGATSPGSDINSIIESFTGNKNTLPDWVGGIDIKPASGGEAPGKLRLRKIDDTLILVFQLVITDLDFTLVSLTVGAVTKLIIRVAVDKLPLISSIPLVEILPPPFDSLLYLWLDDDSGEGLTQEQLTAINIQLTELNIPAIRSKANNKSVGIGAPAAIRAGHHFMILNKAEVVLDHVFGNSTSPAPFTVITLDDGPRTFAAAAQPFEGVPTKGPLDTQLPFLSIKAVTVQFTGTSLVLNIDADMMLGPVKASIIGFQVQLNLTKVQLNHLEKSFVNGAITFGVHGLAISVDHSPLQIAGVFVHDTVSNPTGGQAERYMGGVGITFQKWQFVAVGAYQLISRDSQNYKSIFVYAKLNGPLITLAFATISGVRLGFGYNSLVRSPTISDLSKFPFLTGTAEGGARNDPLVILQSLMPATGQGWVSPKQDSYWAVAGLTLTAFGILSVTAVLMLGFHDSGVVISVLADGVAQMPPEVDANATLFYVEIYMLAELNTIEGYLTVQAALAPTSHVLVPSCRLTGGFALVNWFDPSPHSGDFVFTVGGFHPAFSPPPWYPVPERLGISFTLAGMINVTGSVYFAITPKCVMGGGALHMGLDVGPVSAWLDIALNVFIQFKPFRYMADMKVSVGCAISIKIWFVHIRIKVSVGAALSIEGPDPFRGVADVDFYLFTFTIHFGDQEKPAPAPLSLLQFYEMVRVPGPAPPSTSSAAPKDPAMSRLKFVLVEGLFTPRIPPSPSADASGGFPDSGASSMWQINCGTLSFTIGCDFALTSADLIASDEETPRKVPLPLPLGTAVSKFYSKPMHADVQYELKSTMEITIWRLSPLWYSEQMKFVWPFFTGNLVVKDVPSAMWGSYDKQSDPAVTTNPAGLKNASDATMKLSMGVTLTSITMPPVGPPIDQFDATVAFRWTLGSYALFITLNQQNELIASKPVHSTDSPEQRWRKFGQTWRDSAQSAQPILNGQVKEGRKVPGLLEMAASTLQWDQESPSGNLQSDEVTGADRVWQLVGSVPDMLIDQLSTQYPELPRYADKVAA